MSSSVAGVSIDYGSWSQYDIVLNRHLDMGSSCCALFASSVAVGVLVQGASLTWSRLNGVLRICVVVYDGMQVPDGFDVKDMAGIVFHDRGMDAPSSRWSWTARPCQSMAGGSRRAGAPPQCS